jgi:hypothetical protein
MKQTIKRLASDIGKVLDDNEEANYYNGLFDGGEWSQSGPDFSPLIKRWNLTKDTLKIYCDLAHYWMIKFDELYPMSASRQYRKDMYGPDDSNPWRHRGICLEVLFMEMEMSEKTQCPTCGRMTSDKNGSGVCNDCDSSNVWIDPAGGVHYGNEEDPAKMYE